MITRGMVEAGGIPFIPHLYGRDRIKGTHRAANMLNPDGRADQPLGRHDVTYRAFWGDVIPVSDIIARENR